MKLANPALAFLILFAAGCSPENQAVVKSATDSPVFIQHGKMREVIGMQKHEARVSLLEATAKPHLFAVGALEGLAGEVTVLDGEVYASHSPTHESIFPTESLKGLMATLLVGFHVELWDEHRMPVELSPEEFEEHIRSVAHQNGVDTKKPFPFFIEGKLTDLELHVIRGACPVHSKRNGIELGDGTKPYHAHYDLIDGTLVGVFAMNEAGNLTHPGTSTHTHAIYSDSGVKLTGHVERVGVAKGAVLRLPKM